jgi:hypothetical protein
LNFTGGGLVAPVGVAIDSRGNVWISNSEGSSVSELTNSGVVLSTPNGFNTQGKPGGPQLVNGYIAITSKATAWTPIQGTDTSPTGNALAVLDFDGTRLSGTNGFTGGGLRNPLWVAIDINGNVWVTNQANNANSFTSVSEFSSVSGMAISPPSGYQGLGDIFFPQGIATDNEGNVWVACQGGLNELNQSGTQLSPSGGFSGGGMAFSRGVAVDSKNQIWISNNNEQGEGEVSEFDSQGNALSPSTGYLGGGLNFPLGIATDGSDRIWVANGGNSSVSELNPQGVPISPPTGFTDPTLNLPGGIAVDASGNVWLGNANGDSVTEFVGVATPVKMPLIGNAALP